MSSAGILQMTDSVTLGPDAAVAAEAIVVSPEHHAKAETRWVAPEKQQLLWESWGEQYAVYDTRSGETHLLERTTARLLQRLVACPGTLTDVTQVLSNESGECCDEHSRERNARLLRQLHDAGLVEKAGT